MSSWKEAINSLCLIPELTCPNNCPNCYEKKKSYGTSLTKEEYCTFVEDNLKTLPSLTEVLIDYNGSLSLEDVGSILTIIPPWLQVVITTIPDGMMKLLPLSTRVKFRLSIHSTKDVDLVCSIQKEHEIDCLSVLLEDACAFDLKELKCDIYLLHNKFGKSWRESANSTLLRESFIAGSGLRIILDHCLQTRMNDQECPATTQINLYRDGSIRRCPYQPKEPENADYSKGCSLIGSLQHE